MRRSFRILALLVLCLGVLLAGLWLARKPVAEWAAVAYLANRGVGPVVLDISQLDLDGLAIGGLRIGDRTGPHVRIDSLLAALEGTSVKAVTIIGVAVTGTLKDGQLDAGPVMALMPADHPASELAPRALPDGLPDLTVDDVSLSLTGPLGDLALKFDGTARLKQGRLVVDGPLAVSGPGGQGQGTVALQLNRDLTGRGKLSTRDVVVGPPWLPRELRLPSLDLVAGLQAEYLNVDLNAVVAGGNVDISLVSVEPFDKKPTTVLDASIALPDLAPLLPLIVPYTGPLPLQGGSVDLALSFTATTGELPDISGHLSSGVGEGNLAGKVTLVPTPNSAEGQLESVSLDLDVDAILFPDSVSVTVENLTGRIAEPRPNAIPAVLASQLGADLDFEIARGTRLSLRRADLTRARVKGTARLSSGAVTLEAEAKTLDIAAGGMEVNGLTVQAQGILLEGLSLGSARFDGNMKVAEGFSVDGTVAGRGAWDGGENTASNLSFAFGLLLNADAKGALTATGSGTLSAEQILIGNGAMTVSQPEFTLRDLALSSGQGTGTEIRLEALSGQSALYITALGPDPVGVQPLTVRLDLKGQDPSRLSGPFSLRSSGIALPDMLSADAVEVDGTLTMEKAAVSARLRASNVQVDPVLLSGLPELSLVADVEADPNGLQARGTARSGAVGVDIKAALDAATGAGDVTLELPRTALSSVSSMMRGPAPRSNIVLTAAGHVSSVVNMRFGSGLSGDMNVSIEDGVVATSDATVSGINAAIELTNLFPPQTGALQEVRIARLAGPADMTDMLLRFGLSQDGDETIAQIEHLTGKVFGGELALQPFILHPDEERRAVDVTLRRIDMTQIIELTGLTGFELTGNLSGILPVVIVGESQVAVNGGLLKADGPGVLRLDGTTLRGVLGQQAGEQLDLLIQALEDFRYDTLEIAIDKELEGDADMRVTLGGLNPAVLDGHPFRFNISVKGNADRLLATILTVYRASGGVIEQGIKSLQ